MAKIIKNNTVVANDWTIITLAAGQQPEDVKLPHGNVLVPLSVWRLRKWDLINRAWEHNNKLGVWLSPQEDPSNLVSELDDLDTVGVHFPVPGDGRGYSIATLLRSRYGFKRELRAIGNIGRDYLHFLRRVGFDSIEVAHPESAISSLNDFSEAYQSSVDRSEPLFRRVAANELAQAA